MKRSSITTFGILVAIVLLVASSLPAAAEVQQKVISGQAPTSAHDLAEAEAARALALDSWDLQQMQQLAVVEGLQLRTDRQPLTFLKEVNGQPLYVTDKQAVAFLEERDGRRIYQVALGFEETLRSSKRSALWPVRGKEIVHTASIVFAIVDVAAQEVLQVVRMDIGSADREGTQSIVMRNAAGRQSQFQMKNGEVYEITNNGTGRVSESPIGECCRKQLWGQG